MLPVPFSIGDTAAMFYVSGNIQLAGLILLEFEGGLKESWLLISWPENASSKINKKLRLQLHLVSSKQKFKSQLRVVKIRYTSSHKNPTYTNLKYAYIKVALLKIPVY